MRRTPLALAAVAAAALAASTACGGAAGETGGTGQQSSDKKVTVYSGRSESLIKPVLENFTKATGIAVEARYADTAQTAALLLEEGDRGRADVFIAQDAGALGAVAKKGLFAPLPADVTGKVPAGYRAKDGTWVGVTGRSRVLVYNADQVSAADLPKSVFDLTDPKWRGKVGIAPTNGSFQAFVTALRVQHGDQKAAAFLADLKANQVGIRQNNPMIVSEVNAGRLALGLVNHYYIYELAKEQRKTPETLKAKLHFFPDGDTGALVNVSGVGMLKRAANDPDARALIDYLLGTEAQKHFADKTYEYPLAGGVATAPGLPALASLKAPAIDLNDLDTLEATVKMIKDAGLA